MADFIGKPELVEMVVSATAMKRADVEKAFASVMDICIREVSRGNTVSLLGLGRLTSRHSPRRQSINGFHGERVEINGSSRILFRPSDSLKRAVKANGRGSKA